MPSSESQTVEVINDRYRIRGELGRGGMGCVHLVEDLRRGGMLVALKTLLSRSSSEDHVEGFRREFAHLATLRHANIAAAHDFGTVSGRGSEFFTSEYVRGVDILSGTTECSLDQVLDAGAQILEGLAFIHAHGILHNDLKPSNILIVPATEPEAHMERLEAAAYGRHGTVKIIDFGLLSARGVAWNRVRGTPSYISPERIGCRAADVPSDLYSFGAVLYLLLARVAPFASTDIRSLLKLHVEAEAPDVRQVRPDVPDGVAECLARLLRKDPLERFGSAEEALDALESGTAGRRRAAVRGLGAPPGVARLHGREEELRRLTRSIEEAAGAEPRPKAWILSGAAGTGKTRLVDELRGPVQLSGGAFIRVQGREVQGSLEPVHAAVLAGLEVAGRAEEARSAVAFVGSDGTESLGCVLISLLASLSTSAPILVHIDDADAASLALRRFARELATALARPSGGDRAPRLVLILTLRDAGAIPDEGHSVFTPLSLEAFDRAHAEAFLREIFPHGGPSAETSAVILATGAGNPGILLDTVRHLAESKVIVRRGSRWEFPPTLAGIELPRSAEEAIEARLRDLGTEERGILSSCALVDFRAGTSFLARVAGMREPEVERILADLVRRGFLALDPQGSEPRHEFAQARTPVYLLESLDAESKRRTHRSIALALEEDVALGRRPAEATAEALARHWLGAGNELGFLKYAPAAALALRRAGNLVRAVEYHRRIAESLPEEGAARKIQSLVKLAEMQESLWDIEGARSSIIEALRLGGAVLKPGNRGALLRKCAALELARFRTAEAARLLAEARAACGLADAWQVAAFDALDANILLSGGDRARALDRLQAAERILEGPTPTAGHGKVLAVWVANLAAGVHQTSGSLGRAESILRRILAMISEGDPVQARTAARCSLGGVLLDLGRHEEAKLHLESAVEDARRHNDMRTLSRARERLAETHRRHGDLGEALSIAETAREDAEALGNPSALSSAIRTLARIHHRAGQLGPAQARIAEALRLDEASGDGAQASMDRLLLGTLRLEGGDASSAIPFLQEAASGARARSLEWLEAAAVTRLLEVAFESSTAVDLETLGACVRTLEDSGHLEPLIEALLLRHRVELAGERGKEAAATLARVRELVGRGASRELCAWVEYWTISSHGGEWDPLELRSRWTALARSARNAVLPRLERACVERIRGGVELAAASANDETRV